MIHRYSILLVVVVLLPPIGCIHGKKSGPKEITITTTELPDGVVGEPYSAELKATRRTKGVDLTWSLESGSLPDGLSLSDSGFITGTPTTAGEYTFVVKVVDNYDGSTNTKSLSIRVTTDSNGNGTDTLEITTEQADIPEGIIGNSYTVKFTANRTTDLIWTLDSGNLPDGLQLQSDGYILGVPTAATDTAFVIRVTDQNTGETAIKDFTIIVHNFVISPDTLPDATVEVPYNCQLLTNGGIIPITWTVSTGSLPDGLELDPSGIIVGIPSTPSSAVFVVTATDANGNISARAYTLTVSEP